VSRRPIPAALALAFGLLNAACREEVPWEAPDWRPEREPQRIVAASVLATEVLLEIAPREHIVGVHTLAADLRFSLVAEQVAGMHLLGADPEQLLAVRPDLVITDAFTKAETQQLLEAARVPMLRTAVATTFADIEANVRHIARVCHLDDAGERLVAAMNDELRRITARAQDLGSWRVCSLDGDMHTHGRGSLFDAVVRAAGAKNLAAERGVGPFRKLDVETLLLWRPDALVLAAVPGQEGEERKWLHGHPGLRLLPCVQRDRVVFVPSALLGATSHRLVGAADRLQQTLRSWGRP
jgi:iron complex transport system substrate-binding protein